jgi:monofunctional biosynthetic peptidoglycan transglycosylase
MLRWVNPFTTSVQIQRRLEALAKGTSYQKRYTFVPLGRISPHLQHAVVAAEDTRFFSHNGIDWKEVEKVLDEDLEKGRFRGASTISQQLLKNLFFTTGGSVVRKGAEYALVPVAEAVLSKQRILELYLNVIEWGPGVFGAEAAARYHYGVSASDVSRDQAARLASVLPNPIRRKPARMDRYTGIIQDRMTKMGW